MKIGTKIVAQYGAMIPTVYGTVTEIDNECNVIVFKDDYDGKLFACTTESIKDIMELEKDTYQVGVFA